jgi:hypothetical protein
LADTAEAGPENWGRYALAPYLVFYVGFVLLPSFNLTMEHIRQTFAQCQRERRPALVTYVTAGFPRVEETRDILLGMQAGGAGESLPQQLRTLKLKSVQTLLNSVYLSPIPLQMARPFKNPI